MGKGVSDSDGCWGEEREVRGVGGSARDKQQAFEAHSKNAASRLDQGADMLRVSRAK